MIIYYEARLQEVNTCLAEVLGKPHVEEAFFVEKGMGVMKNREMILILWLKSCPDIAHYGGWWPELFLAHNLFKTPLPKVFFKKTF